MHALPPAHPVTQLSKLLQEVEAAQVERGAQQLALAQMSHCEAEGSALQASEPASLPPPTSPPPAVGLEQLASPDAMQLPSSGGCASEEQAASAAQVMAARTTTPRFSMALSATMPSRAHTRSDASVSFRRTVAPRPPTAMTSTRPRPKLTSRHWSLRGSWYPGADRFARACALDRIHARRGSHPHMDRIAPVHDPPRARDAPASIRLASHSVNEMSSIHTSNDPVGALT
jgi:hypothetical protein